MNLLVSNNPFVPMATSATVGAQLYGTKLITSSQVAGVPIWVGLSVLRDPSLRPSDLPGMVLAFSPVLAGPIDGSSQDAAPKHNFPAKGAVLRPVCDLHLSPGHATCRPTLELGLWRKRKQVIPTIPFVFSASWFLSCDPSVLLLSKLHIPRD